MTNFRVGLNPLPWVEIEPEVEAVLSGVPDTVLGFGPDTGHLTWAGMDAVAVMDRHADRIAAVHVKDVRLDQAKKANASGADYTGSTPRTPPGVDRTGSW